MRIWSETFVGFNELDFVCFEEMKKNKFQKANESNFKKQCCLVGIQESDLDIIPKKNQRPGEILYSILQKKLLISRKLFGFFNSIFKVLTN